VVDGEEDLQTEAIIIYRHTSSYVILGLLKCHIKKRNT